MKTSHVMNIVLVVLCLVLPVVPVYAQGEDVLLIQTSEPWEQVGDSVGAGPNDGVTSDTIILDNIGKSYRIASLADIQNDVVQLADYAVVLLVNDQTQAFYDEYAARVADFEDYVQQGGTLLFFAASDGWAGGILNANLPGGVQWISGYEEDNVIVDYTHPIVTGEFSDGVALTNADLHGNYCSHGAFNPATLPTGSNIIIQQAVAGNPTLVEYRLGEGTVLASTLTWEFYALGRHSSSGGGFAVKGFDDVFLRVYVLGGVYKHIPTLSEWGLIAFAGLLGGYAVRRMRGRRAAQA